MVIDYFKEEFKLTDQDIKDGMAEAYNPGRLDLVSKKPRILLDGAHNTDAIDMLLEGLKSFDYNRLIIGFSILKDKDHADIIKKLAKISDVFIITFIDDNPRAMEANDIKKEANNFAKELVVIEDSKEAFEYSLTLAKDSDLILWCGSLYLVGKILSFVKK